MAILSALQAAAAQLDDLINPASDIPIHFEPIWFPIAETPQVDMRVSSASGLEQGMTGFTRHNTYGAFPVTIRARCGMADSDAGQELLYALMDDSGPLSILAALASDDTLGGVIDSISWGDGFPWTGVVPYLDANGDGSLAGSELTVVFEMIQS